MLAVLGPNIRLRMSRNEVKSEGLKMALAARSCVPPRCNAGQVEPNNGQRNCYKKILDDFNTLDLSGQNVQIRPLWVSILASPKS